MGSNRTRISLFLFLVAMAGAAKAVAPGEPARAIIRREVIDLRDLPARSRLSTVAIEIHGPAAADAHRPRLSIAINGIVAARAPMGRNGRVMLRAVIDERLLAMRNVVEVAAYIPDCTTPSCRAAVASIRATGPLRQEYGAARADATFAQLATRFRNGMTILHEPGVAAEFATRIRDALAPHARPLSEDGGQVMISRQTPPDIPAPIRFDLGPVALVRQDGVSLIAPDVLDELTVVQVLRAGDHPAIWVRPGRYLPPRLDLDSGDIAIFGRNGRVMAFSSDSDARTLHPAYGPGVDADGSLRSIRLWRWLLLIIWAAASGGLWLIYRRLPPLVTPKEAASWAA